MTNELMFQIGSLFITFLSMSTGIAAIFYLGSWISYFFLSLVFPSRY